MTREEIISKLKRYFIIQELVDKATYVIYGDNAWQFFTIELLETLLAIREGIDKPITINNWHSGGEFQQRGLRHNLSPITEAKTIKDRIYLSAHILGAGVDFDVKGMLAEDVRQWLTLIQEELPHKIRLEHINTKTNEPINWVHLDTIDNGKDLKVYLFNI